MARFLSRLLVIVIAMVAAHVAFGQVIISSVSSTTVTRSGRVVISGSGFGLPGPSSDVLVGGLVAPHARWNDNLIVAYVPEATPLGSNDIVVRIGSAFSPPITITVVDRQPNGRVNWRFQADAPYIFQRPSLAPDGTIIAHDAGGFVYSLAPNGGLNWIFHTRTFASGPPSVGTDGTVYVGNSTTVTALNPDGSLKWEFTSLDPRAIAAGPTVGPDGKIYVFFDPVTGVYAFNPDGTIAWTYSSTDLFDLFEYGAEFAFGPTVPGGPSDQVYLSFGESPSGFLWAWNMASGSLAFATPETQTWDNFMQPQGQATTAPDGTIFTACSVDIGSSTSVNAFNPDGTSKWRVTEFGGTSAPDLGPNGNVYFAFQLIHLGALDSSGHALWSVTDGVNSVQYPIANPAGGMVFAGGGTNGQPGFVRAYNAANGATLWEVGLPFENGGNQAMNSRPRFAADGQTVYFGTTIPTAASDTYSYLYAIDTSGTAVAATLTGLTLTPTTVDGGTSSLGQITLSAPAPAGGAVIALSSSSGSAQVPG
ncbi:MAG TPA: PQQ-binding-like beta-propeller repeat protein, partial [Fimbriimonadaceae bacterium]|nr:PQQ-binding-like beta-propeller repeat protein [Fimbriimonadaceae bacterium]